MKRSPAAKLRLTRINFARDHAPSAGSRPIAPAADALVSVQRQLSELRAVARDAVELFYLVCPDRFLAELEPEVRNAFDAILTETDPVGP